MKVGARMITFEHLAGPHYREGFLDTLSALRKTVLDEENFGVILRNRLVRRIETIVAILTEDGKRTVVATATVFVETKFYGNVAHIEDVATHPNFRGRGYGGATVLECIRLAGEQRAYKVILDCADHNVAFYEKLGFRKFENQMRLDI
jgi:glucosamine-phosphate N-acetyltransferase